MRLKRLGTILITVTLLFSLNSAFAIEVLQKDGEHESQPIPAEPLVTPDPRAKSLSVEGYEADYVENSELKDTGFVELHWNSTAYAKYGCSIASINYENPTRSNIGMTLSVAIFDGNLIKYFGTTYRSEEEVLELALEGLDALQNGIKISDAPLLVKEDGLFYGLTEEEVSLLTKSELIQLLVEQNFLGMSAEELNLLDEDGVKALNEIEKLTLAQLGGYNFYTFYQKIGETGVINPGYAIYEVELQTLPGMLVIPKGEYEGIFVLNAFDEYRNELSDFFIHLPITLKIAEDLPEELQEEYGVSLAVRID